jgi:hypothetical protein
MIVIGGVAIVAGVAAAFVMVLSNARPMSAASTPDVAAPAAPVSASPATAPAPQPPAAMAEPSATAPETPPAPVAEAQPGQPKGAGLLGHAASGDAAALASLEKKTELTADEALALYQGRGARSLAEVQALGAELASSSAPAAESVAKLRAYAQDARTAGHALAAMARLKDAIGPDLLYEVWTGTPKRNEATALAEALLRHDGVRARASKPLAVALDLRTATECGAVKALLPQVAQHGDRRSLVPLSKLTLRRGCGANKKQDCWPCLRQDKGKAIAEAMKAVRRRPEPKH